MRSEFTVKSSNGRPAAHGLIRASGLVCLATMLTAGAAPAQPARELVHLINEYRSEERTCNGRRMRAAGPLAPHAGLSDVKLGAGSDTEAALKEEGYAPAQFQVIRIAGPGSADRAMKLIRQRYCRPLLNSEYADIGVSREGDTWRLVLARPLLSPDLEDWQEAGRKILTLTNQARSESRRCGSKQFSAAPPLSWAPLLAGASLVHSRDMAKRNYFRHRAKDGSRAAERVDRKGYEWRRVGENIAAGQGSAEQVVSAWLSSPPHCANLMNSKFAEMGAAYAVDLDSDSTIYWTQVFGTPR